MDVLKKFVRLSSRVALYVPGTTDVASYVDSAAYVARVAAAFSDLFGGATASKAAGYWMSGAHGLVSEDVTIVYAYADTETLKTAIHKVLQVAQQLKVDMSQEAISLEVNGEMYFI